jgi:hypothetical protein
MKNESDLKRDLVATILKEGGYGRRLEDRYAVGTLDLLLMTRRNVVYAEVKMLKGVALPARVAQRKEIVRFNAVENPRAHALVIGYRDGMLGFGLPGTHWQERYFMRWPHDKLMLFLDTAVNAVFAKEPA